MALFDEIPDRLFTVLTSSKKALYLDALFVVRDVFKNTELVISKDDLIAMMMNQLEDYFINADFSEEIEEDGTDEVEPTDISGKTNMLLRHLIKTGWIEEEEDNHFNKNITIPEYSYKIINLLYDLSYSRNKEYNSFVYSTYASLKNADDNPGYLYNALSNACKNTEDLVDELKILFNNIKRYKQRAINEMEINNLLQEYFVSYKAGVIDSIYIPLKTIDSVPRFKGTIVTILNNWYSDEQKINMIVDQGMHQQIFETREDGLEKIQQMINYIVNIYEGIEDMIDQIDQKHSDYTRVSIEKIQYMISTDTSIKGKIIDLLKKSNDESVMELLQQSLMAQHYKYADQASMYARMKRTARSSADTLKIEKREESVDANSILKELRNYFSNKKIDVYVHKMFTGKSISYTELAPMNTNEDFILFMLSTIRGKEKSADYTIEFEDDYCENNGYRLPKIIFRRK